MSERAGKGEVHLQRAESLDHQAVWRLHQESTSSGPEGTEAVGEGFARHLKSGEAVALIGELGAGKTTFVRGLMRGLGYRGRVRSPSFTLINQYPSDPVVFHADLYRLVESSELIALDLDEAREEGITIVEWGDRFPSEWGIPDWRVAIETVGSGQERLIRIEKRDATSV